MLSRPELRTDVDVPSSELNIVYISDSYLGSKVLMYIYANSCSLRWVVPCVAAGRGERRYGAMAESERIHRCVASLSRLFAIYYFWNPVSSIARVLQQRKLRSPLGSRSFVPKTASIRDIDVGLDLDLELGLDLELDHDLDLDLDLEPDLAHPPSTPQAASARFQSDLDAKSVLS